MSNPHKGRTGLDRIRHAAGYSLQGMAAAYRHESAFRQETWLAVALLPLASVLITPARERPGSSAELRGLVRMFFILLLIEAASLVGNYY